MRTLLAGLALAVATILPAPPAPTLVTAAGTTISATSSTRATVTRLAVPSASLIVAGVPAPHGGVWLVSAEGAVFPVGGAPAVQGVAGISLLGPVVAAAADNAGPGLWLVTSLGQVIPLGGAPGLTGLPARGVVPDGPIVGMAAVPSAGSPGVWLVSAEGAIYALGQADPFVGSLPPDHIVPPVPIVGMAAAGTGGYWLVAKYGEVYAFGSAKYQGAPSPFLGPYTAIASVGTGYWLVSAHGAIYPFGASAPANLASLGLASASPVVGIVVPPAGTTSTTPSGTPAPSGGGGGVSTWLLVVLAVIVIAAPVRPVLRRWRARRPSPPVADPPAWPGTDQPVGWEDLP